VFIDFVGCTLALHRQHASTFSKERRAPPGELVERGDRPGRDGVDLPDGASNVLVLCPASHHCDVEPEFIGDLGEELRTAQERLDEDHPNSRTRERQWDAGESCAATDVGHGFAIVDQFRDGSAVENVPGPQPVDLCRTDQTALDAGAGQDPGVVLSCLNGWAEYRSCLWGRRRCFTVFHVKHPSDARPELHGCNSA
jgi:hypothetical protein